jgi:hypothetical protein
VATILERDRNHKRWCAILTHRPCRDRAFSTRPTNHVAAIIVGAPRLERKPIGPNRFGANDPRGGSGLAEGY